MNHFSDRAPPKPTTWEMPHAQALHERLQQVEWHLSQTLPQTHANLDGRMNVMAQNVLDLRTDLKEINRQKAVELEELKELISEEKKERQALVFKIMVAMLTAVGSLVASKLSGLLNVSIH